MKARCLLPLFILSLSQALHASVSVVTKVRCEIDFPFDSSAPDRQQLEACLQKMKGSTVRPDHVAIYASASPPGKPAYNFELSKRRSQAIADRLRQEFPKAEQEFFPGGVNPSYGQKAVVVASISSSEPIYLQAKGSAPEPERWLKLQRIGMTFGAHELRDSAASYKALGAYVAGRTPALAGVPWDIGVDAASLQAEDFYDHYAFSLDAGPLFSWHSLDLAPKAVLRHLVSTEGTSAVDIGFRVQAILRFDAWHLALTAGASQESKEALGALGRSF